MVVRTGPSIRPRRGGRQKGRGVADGAPQGPGVGTLSKNDSDQVEQAAPRANRPEHLEKISELSC